MKYLPYILIISLYSCKNPTTTETTNTVRKTEADIADKLLVNTVTGPIIPDSLGMTLIHEHILVDFIGADNTGYYRWNRNEVVEKMLPYLLEVKEYGIKTIIETTPAFLGRDVLILKELSEKSGINILTNTGLYGAVNDKYLPGYTFVSSVDSLASLWTAEYYNGIEDTGIHPGFMKISVDSNSILSEVDAKLVKAALETHKRTGLTIVSHTGPDAPAFDQLKLIAEAGVSPSAWVWTHAQDGSDEARIKAAKLGAWISLDNVMVSNYEKYVEALVCLKNAGLLRNVLISHDAGYYDPDLGMESEIRGYTAIFTHLIPDLKDNGFTENDIIQLLVHNPKRAYTPMIRLQEKV